MAGQDNASTLIGLLPSGTPAVGDVAAVTSVDPLELEWSPQSGTTVQVLAPTLLPSVNWALVVPGNATAQGPWSYTPNSWPTPATTITATANGVLAINSDSPALGDRVVVMDEWNDYFQLFTVTDIGSVSTPWVLTATDDDITGKWAVEITEGTYAGGVAISSDAGTNYWNGSTASTYSTASGYYSTASGNNATASGYSSTASGYSSTASGNNATASGYSSTASGNNALAYSHGQLVDVGSPINQVVGSAQSGRVLVSGSTSDATPTALYTDHQQPYALILVDASGNPVWNRTIGVSGTVIARRTDTPGTDSTWKVPVGILRGDGTGAYTWVGGTAPVPTVDVQDAAASGWAVALSIGSSVGVATLLVTVTGEAGNTISWQSTLELSEVAG